MNTFKLYVYKLIVFSMLLSACVEEEPEIIIRLPTSPTYKNLPVPLLQVDEYIPLGRADVLPVEFVSFLLKDPYRSTPDIPVYAPTDGFIVSVNKGSWTAEDNDLTEMPVTTFDDFTIEISVATTARFWYGHIAILSDSINRAIPGLRTGSNRTNIPVKSGQLIGYAGFHPRLDVGMYDRVRDNGFISPARYTDQYRYAQSWTDYLDPALRQRIWSLNKRTAEPRSGVFNYDADNFLSGNWFLAGSGSNQDKSRHLAFVWHHRYTDRLTISDGYSLRDGNHHNLWWIVGNSIDPDTVSIQSGMLKIEVAAPEDFLKMQDPDPAGTLVIKMVENRKLKIEWFEGQKPEDIEEFTSAHREYIR
ncbi:MAG: hypothetical protein JJU28_07575 [Cyclobacteriaceae bacterium]|nr:hypothetical protein [Cyclobacteriaceae bacterium]